MLQPHAEKAGVHASHLGHHLGQSGAARTLGALHDAIRIDLHHVIVARPRGQDALVATRSGTTTASEPRRASPAAREGARPPGLIRLSALILSHVHLDPYTGGKRPLVEITHGVELEALEE